MDTQTAAVLEPQAPPTPEPNGQARERVNITERTVCVSLTIKSLGNSRKVSNSQVTVDADKDLIRVSKTLLDSQELKAIKTLDGAVRQYLYTRALPSLFRSGIYLVPTELVEQVDARLLTFREDREKAVDLLINAYPVLKADAQERLRSTYNEGDYPDEETLRRQFSMSWRYIAFETPEKLRGINPAIFQREREKAEQAWESATDEIRGLLRQAFADLVGHMAERLQPGDDGKKKVFKNTLVSNLAEFLETFDLRNVTDDDELKRLVDRAKAMLGGVEPQDLRDNEALRDSLGQSMTKIKGDLDSMLTTKPSRAISFDDL